MRALVAQGPDATRLTHPLLPGVRGAHVWNAEWPRTFHDAQLTGFSPLVCGMRVAPPIVAQVSLPGRASWIRPVSVIGEGLTILVFDDQLRMITPQGNVLWTNEDVGDSSRLAVLFVGDLHQTNCTKLLLGEGPQLIVVDAKTGVTDWQFRLEPEYVRLVPPRSVVVDDILFDQPGLEAAVFPLYGEHGYLVQFPTDAPPSIAWKSLAVVPGEHGAGAGGERADHGCWVQVDTSSARRPVIWTVRHHRCRGFDAKNGKTLSSLSYNIGGGARRNYGPARLGNGPNNERLLCVVSERVQFHVHALRLHRDRPAELIWEHYYGELLKTDPPGALEMQWLAVDDVDRDGTTEIVYNVNDPEQDFRPTLKIRDAATGRIQWQQENCHGERYVAGTDDHSWIVVRPAAGHQHPQSDRLFFRIEPTEAANLVDVARDAKVVSSADDLLPSDQLMLRQRNEQGDVELVVYQFGHELQPVTRSANRPIPTAVMASDAGPPLLVHSRLGEVSVDDWNGDRWGQVRVSGAPPAMMSAADLDGDGRAELLATSTVENKLNVYTLNAEDQLALVRSHPYHSADPRHVPNPVGPLLYDLLGTGRPCVICPGVTLEGHPVVRTFRHDGSLLWERVLATDSTGAPTRLNAGAFLPRQQPAVVASSQARQGDSILGTLLLDGHTGDVLWHKSGYLSDRGVSLPYYPMGVPTAFDFDADGIDEIGMDLYCYMAWLRGTNGEFVFRRHTANLGVDGALYAGRFHNSYVPIFPDDSSQVTTAPHWLVPLGSHGSVGLMRPEPSEGIWRDELGYDMPQKVGMVDVDGDGELEVGYVPRSRSTFVCRDLWTGKVEWQLDLPERPVSRVITADVDGDQRGEFLVGSFCLGVRPNGQGVGEILWQAPLPLDWAIIADFDGDGVGEIAAAHGSRIAILRARRD